MLDEAFVTLADLELTNARPEWRRGSFILLTVVQPSA